MSKLELKIPPVLVGIIFVILMWLIAQLTSEANTLKEYRWGLFLTFFSVGVIFALLGVASFKRAETTVNPVTPNASSSLVTSGIYQYSRNPMYVGFFFMLLGWALLLSNVFAVALTWFFVLYLNRFQIKPEEKALRELFGVAFCEYEKRVRRWL